MDLNLAGRRAFVAGSSSGIGAGIAVMLATEGADVIVHGRNEASAQAVMDRVSATGRRSAMVLGDLDDMRAVERVAEEALRHFGGLDILVNCAGAAPMFEPWLETPIERWEERFRTSALYVVALARAVIPGMMESGWGRIVNISSGVAFRPSAFGPEYSAAKAALQSITSSLVPVLGDSGVTVNAVSSGVVLTENTETVMKLQAERFGFKETGDALEKRVVREMWPVPLGRVGRIDDIAAAVCFLASDRAGYITGATLRVDGGTAGWMG